MDHTVYLTTMTVLCCYTVLNKITIVDVDITL